ncbi:insulinase family protein [bacterium]|jgi:zinc protease|nr:insulinase family protein [bacterium]
MTKQKNVFTYTLKNGLNVLIRPSHHVPKVSVQLWYNVGSKDEKSGEKGLAHLIEHMIFKGTEKLSESDINMITHKLSGSCNAFTSYDYTGYLFNFPSHHWHEALPIMSDCMKNCTFKEELLNSELKAVIQELKMYKDSFSSCLVEELVTQAFPGHPYQSPIIGYKHDLFNVTREDLLRFYQKHYIPNNATLIIVGDVDPSEAIKEVEKNFSKIESNFDYKKDKFYIKKDLAARSVSLFRDIKQSSCMFLFSVPGAKEGCDYALDTLCSVLGSGKSSRLYKKLVDDHGLAVSVSSFVYDLFDGGLFFICVQPKDDKSFEKIRKIIFEEISDIVKNKFKKDELDRAARQAKNSLITMLENNQQQAYLIGKFYLATGDPEYLFTYLDQTIESAGEQAHKIVKDNFLPSIMLSGQVLPLVDNDKDYQLSVQALSDEQDKTILSRKTRESGVEKGVRVDKINIQKPKPFKFPKAEKFVMDNGLTVLHYHNPNIPQVFMSLDLEAKHFFDPNEQQGLYNFMTKMIGEGTKKYPGKKLSEAVEGRGMTLNVVPGYFALNMLKEDFGAGLDIFSDIVSAAEFSKKQLQKIQLNVLTEIKSFWDNPSYFSGLLLKEMVYKKHPYSKDYFGSKDVIKKITQKDLFEFYGKVISPQDSILSVVGDLSGNDIEAEIRKAFGSWSGPEVLDPFFPVLTKTQNKEKLYKISRDQVVLAFAGLSVEMKDPDFDKLLVFDQIFGGGALGSMSSRLFQIREETGLFYGISGSLLALSDKQPGMAIVKTLVSLDRLKEAEEVITKTINTAADNVAPNEFEQAQNALALSLIGNFESNRMIAASFSYLERYGFPKDFFDNRAQNLRKITCEQMQEAAKKILDTNNMCVLKVGRV